MIDAYKKFRKLRSQFRLEERGSMSVEAVLWLPVYIFFIALIADTSMMLHSRSMALRILEDANRHAVTGYLVDQNEVTAQITTLIGKVSENATVQVVWGTDDIHTVVRMPGSDLQVLGLLGILADVEITVQSYNRFEI